MGNRNINLLLSRDVLFTRRWFAGLDVEQEQFTS